VGRTRHSRKLGAESASTLGEYGHGVEREPAKAENPHPLRRRWLKQGINKKPKIRGYQGAEKILMNDVFRHRSCGEMKCGNN
jgi:hypothetical protein